jgi:hypothetical protein
MDSSLKEKFLAFCYPPDMQNREKEILLDQQYWKDTAIFIVFDKTKEIVGSVQFIAKTATNKLPLEYAKIKEDRSTDNQLTGTHYKLSSERCAEIYRCRRSFALDRESSFRVVTSLFKAIWIKTLQTSCEFICLSYDKNNLELKNLYCRKLFFQNTNITLQFDDNSQDWNLLLKYSQIHESIYATLSKSHFYMQTWWKKNSRVQGIRFKPSNYPVPATIFSEENASLIASSVKSKRKEQACS